MRFFLAFAAGIAVAGSALAAVAVAPRVPSPTPGPCTYTCPSRDHNGFTLVGTHALSSTSVRCDYYPVAVDTAAYTCTYDTQVRPLRCRELHRAHAAQTGALTADRDVGGCPAMASKGACTSKRGARDVEGQYEAYKRRAAVRAAAGPTPTVPRAMSLRAELRKRKLMGKGAW
jgi:hypothetical protein